MTMSKTERNDLRAFIRRRSKAARTQAELRAAELKADVEGKLGAIYSPDDDAAMRQLLDEAEAAIEDVRHRLTARCEELGIPANLGPTIGSFWLGRGENSLRERRSELRRMAHSRIEAMQRRAYAEIERQAVELEGTLITGGLESDAAKQFLAELPNVDQLMSPLDASEIKQLGNST